MNERIRVDCKNQVLILILLLQSACTYSSTSTPPSHVESGLTHYSTEGEWLGIYFTIPTLSPIEDYDNGPDKILAAAIESARLTVDVAIYNLNLWSIRDALIDAHSRGVVVRIVAESDNLAGEEFQDLIDAGISVIGDQREGLMHNKFLIIDRAEVWTGSMNYTLNGAYEDNNSLLYFRSNAIAEDYLVEFNEMYEDNLFGENTRAATPNPKLVKDGITVEVLFSPDDDVKNRILDLLKAAEKSIHFLAYSFTDDQLGDAIRSSAASGVTVAGVMDENSIASNTGTEYDPFLQIGMDVRVDANDGLMHHKVIVIDGDVVITGSYNFTANADEVNDENTVIIHDSHVASYFLDEFWRIYNLAATP